MQKGEFKGRKLSDIQPGAKLEDKDIQGRPAEIAAARLEYVVKSVLLQGKLSDLEKETAAFETMRRAPDEVRREVLKQLPALLTRLKPSPANAARVRAAQGKFVGLHLMVEPALTAEWVVSERLMNISGKDFENWQASSLVDVFTRNLPPEITPYLMAEIERRIPALEDERNSQADTTNRFLLETISQRIAGLRRVQQGLLRQAQEMRELEERLANVVATTPGARASAITAVALPPYTPRVTRRRPSAACTATASPAALPPRRCANRGVNSWL